MYRFAKGGGGTGNVVRWRTLDTIVNYVDMQVPPFGWCRVFACRLVVVASFHATGPRRRKKICAALLCCFVTHNPVCVCVCTRLQLEKAATGRGTRDDVADGSDILSSSSGDGGNGDSGDRSDKSHDL